MYQDSEDNIKVVLRIRPFNQRESDDNSSGCIIESEENPEKSFYFGTGEDNKEFSFDYIAGQASTQEEIFKVVGEPLADFALDGYNVCIFAYGQTGTGKTHTMYGKIGDDEQEGLQTRILKKSFADINGFDKDVQFITYAHYFEIYNENIIDLLAENMEEDKKANIQIREDVKKGVYVENLQCKYIQDYQQAMDLLQVGNKQRHVAATKMNLESSRSHSIFQFHIQQKTVKNGITNFKASKINFVDLAGSERQKSTQTTGDRLKEATNINKSLSVLGRVINQLVEKMNKKKTLHIPYRDSKLTFLLKDSLGGNAKTLMIATITASDLAFQETLSTLKFAQRAKMIRNQAEKNEESTGSLKLLQKEIKILKQQIESYKQKISDYEKQKNNNNISQNNTSNTDQFSQANNDQQNTTITDRLDTVENEQLNQISFSNQNELDLLQEIQNLKDQLSLKEHELNLEQIKYKEREFDFQHQIEKNKKLEQQIEDLQNALKLQEQKNNNIENNGNNINDNNEVDFMKKSVFEQSLEQKLANLQSENEFLNKKLEKFYILQDKFMNSSKLKSQSMLRIKDTNSDNNLENDNQQILQNQSIIKEEDPFLNLMTQNDELRNQLNLQIDENNELKTELSKVNEDNDTLRQTIFYISSQLNQARKEKKNDNISNIHFQRKTYSVASFGNGNGNNDELDHSRNDDTTLNDILNQIPNEQSYEQNSQINFFQYYSNFKYQVLIDSIVDLQKFHTDKNAIVHNHFTVYIFIVWQNTENQKLLVKHFKHVCKKIYLQHNCIINLMGNNLNDENMQRICLQGLKYFEKIKKLNLNLSHNMISNDGISFLCQALKEFKQLQELNINLQNNEAIDENGIKQLMNTIKQIPSLVKFDLIRDKIKIKQDQLRQDIESIGTLEHQSGFQINIKQKNNTSIKPNTSKQSNLSQPTNQMGNLNETSRSLQFKTYDTQSQSKFKQPQKRESQTPYQKREIIDQHEDGCKVCNIF